MKKILLYLFPSLLRPEREKQNFEKYIPFALLAAGVIYFLIQYFIIKNTILSASFVALQKAAMLYFSYLIMIELSPDAPHIYKPGFAVIALVLCAAHRSEMFFSTLFFLCNIRILTKSSGYLTGYGELVAMSFFTGLQFLFSPFSYPLLFGITLLLDYKYKHKDHRNIPFAVLSLLLSMLWLKNGFGIITRELNVFLTLGIFVISLLYIFRLSLLKNILSFNDTKTNLISPKRVKSAGILLLLSLMIMAIGHGILQEFLHLWAVLACISVPYLQDMKKLFFKEN